MKKYLDHGYRVVRPWVDYALGWLAPDLLGTGFELKIIDDTNVHGSIPYIKHNFDSQREIQPGVIFNAGLSMVKELLAYHLGHRQIVILKMESSLKKNTQWNKKLSLSLNINDIQLDQFFMQLQAEGEAALEAHVALNKSTENHLKLNLLIKIKKQLSAN